MVAAFSWTTQEDGTVVGGPPLPAVQITDELLQWEPIATENAIRTGVPLPWIMGTIYGESGGHQPTRPTFDGGIGVMMITSNALKQGLPDDQVFLPENNIRLGTDYLATLRGYRDDLPSVASMYNSGGSPKGPHLADGFPWGLREYTIPSTGARPYISKVVAMNNALIASGMPYHPIEGGVGTPTAWGGIFPIVFGAALGWGGLWLARRIFA